MHDFFGYLQEFYLWIKALHLISVLFWGAALFYLPRLFVYHAQVPTGTSRDAMLKQMERRLLKFIANPAMISTLLFGLLLVVTPGVLTPPLGWFHAKVFLLVFLFAYHGFCVRFYKRFQVGQNCNTHVFYRIFNEIPPFLFLIIVVLVIVKPF